MSIRRILVAILASETIDEVPVGELLVDDNDSTLIDDNDENLYDDSE